MGAPRRAWAILKTISLAYPTTAKTISLAYAAADTLSRCLGSTFASESGITENFGGTTLGAWPQGHMQGFNGGTTL